MVFDVSLDRTNNSFMHFQGLNDKKKEKESCSGSQYMCELCGFCSERFHLPLGAWDVLRYFIVTLPGPSIISFCYSNTHGLGFIFCFKLRNGCHFLFCKYCSAFSEKLKDQRKNGPVNAHIISGPSLSTKHTNPI